MGFGGRERVAACGALDARWVREKEMGWSGLGFRVGRGRSVQAEISGRVFRFLKRPVFEKWKPKLWDQEEQIEGKGEIEEGEICSRRRKGRRDRVRSRKG